MVALVRSAWYNMGRCYTTPAGDSSLLIAYLYFTLYKDSRPYGDSNSSMLQS